MRPLLAATLLTLTLTACSNTDDEPTEDAPADVPSFAEVADTCQSQNERARMEPEDEQLSVSIVPPSSREDEDRLGLVIACVTTELGSGREVTEQVAATRGTDGQQAASWDGFTAEWVFDASSVGLVFLVRPA